MLPFETLRAALQACEPRNNRTEDKGKAVAHWFRSKDLRAEDNLGLHAAHEAAVQGQASLVTFFVVNSEELQSQDVGANRNALMVEGLKILQSQLRDRGIPLHLLVSRSTKETVEAVVKFMADADAVRLFANYEYEYDEVTRDIAVAEASKNGDFSFTLLHDQTVVEPGTICSAKSGPRKVFTPFWHDWIPVVSKLDLELKPVPSQVQRTSLDVPDVDLDKLLSEGSDQHIIDLWPAGHDAGIAKLHEFVDKKIDGYGKNRSVPAKDCTSRLSPYFALGFISVRESLAAVRERKKAKFGTSDSGVDSWVREIAFREFYRQMVAVVNPHVVMNLPTSLRLNDVETVDPESEEGVESWKRWVDGRTGYPFVDAGMRQLQAEGYMHNRARMNVASYLKFNMLMDYRLGLAYFASKLVDWDCCNNTYGWDPSLTVFNPVIQGEKCDPGGQYIRKWVPELRSTIGKAIFDPYHRLSSKEFAKLGYPEPMEAQKDLGESKTRATDAYKQAYRKVKKEEEDA